MGKLLLFLILLIFIILLSLLLGGAPFLLERMGIIPRKVPIIPPEIIYPLPRKLYSIDLLNESRAVLDDLTLSWRIGRDVILFKLSDLDGLLIGDWAMPTRILFKNRYLSFSNRRGDRKVVHVRNSPEEFREFVEKEERYIIELEETPLLIKRNELEERLGAKEIEKKLSYLMKVKKRGVETKELNQQISTLESMLRKVEKEIEHQLKLHRKKIELSHDETKIAIATILNKSVDESIESEFFHLFNGFSVIGKGESIRKVEKLPRVKRIWKDHRVEAFLMDSIPLLRVNNTWDLGYTGEGIKIAIIDTGIDYTHPDLGGCFGIGCKVMGGYDFFNDDADPIDDNGHGTHVAGIAAGNGTIKGVAPSANLLAYKVLDARGWGYESDVIAGVEQAVVDGADVISMSLGTFPPEDCYDLALSRVVDVAVDSGVVVVVAAGNSGSYGYRSISSPGCARKVITVGASYKTNYEAFWWNCTPGTFTSCGFCENGTVYCNYWSDKSPRTDQVTAFSSKGFALADNMPLVKPDVIAPGAIICSARYDEIFPEGEHPYYHPCIDDLHFQAAGTSMATPMVSGLAALLIQAYPEMEPEEIKSLLMVSTKDLGYDPLIQGSGRVDALKAINSSFIVLPPTLSIPVGENSIDILLKNLKDNPLNLELRVENLTSFFTGKKYNAISLNVTSLSMPALTNTTVKLNLDLQSLPEGDFFYANILIDDGRNVSRIPIIFTTFSLLRVEIYNASNEPSSFDTILGFDETGSVNFSYLFKGKKNVTFFVLSGNYTVFAIFRGLEIEWGAWWFPHLTGILPPFILSDRIEILPSSSRTLVLNASRANKIKILGENPNREPFHFFLFEIGIQNNKTGFVIGSYGFPWVGNQTMYVSNLSDESIDYNISTGYMGVVNRYCNQSELECEYPYLENIQLAEEQYAIGWILDTVNQDRTLVYNKSSLMMYNYTYNYPKELWLKGKLDFTSSILFSPSSQWSVCWTENTGVPLNRTIYLTQEGFVYRHEVNDWYNQESDLTYNMEPQHFYFGTLPYQLPYFLNTNESISLRDKMVRGYASNTFFRSWMTYPSIEVYRDGELIYDESDYSFWNSFSLNTPPGNFLVRVTIPIAYPVWSFSVITANFTLPAKDVNPPRLNRIEVKPYFKYKESLEMKLNLTDDFGIRDVDVYYRSNGSWESLPVSKSNDLYNSSITVTDVNVRKIDLRISVVDVNGNTINYTIIPAAILARNVSVTLNSSSKILRGGKILLDGYVKERGRGIYGMRVVCFINGSFFEEDMTDYYDLWLGLEKGKYEFETEIPCTYTSPTVNLSVMFEGTNFYSRVENKTEVEVVPSLDFTTDTLLIDHDNLINVSGGGAVATIERSDIDWNFSTLVKYENFVFNPRNYGNYTITFSTACDKISKDIFANVSEKPRINHFYINPTFPLATHKINFFVDVYSQTNNSLTINISNSTHWSVYRDLEREELKEYDYETGEPYSRYYTWRMNLSNLSIGIYEIKIELADQASQTAEIIEELYVYPLVNATFNVTDHEGNPQNRTLFIELNYVDYLLQNISGSLNVQIPDVAYFDQSFVLGLLNFIKYGETGTFVAFVNSSIKESVEFITEYHEEKRELPDKIIYSVYAFEPNFEYDETLFTIIYKREKNLIRCLTSIEMNNISRSTLYACEEYDFVSRRCKTGWRNATQISKISTDYIHLEGTGNTTAIAFGEPSFCGDDYCSSYESCSSCPQDCGTCPPSTSSTTIKEEKMIGKRRIESSTTSSTSTSSTTTTIMTTSSTIPVKKVTTIKEEPRDKRYVYIASLIVISFLLLLIVVFKYLEHIGKREELRLNEKWTKE